MGGARSRNLVAAGHTLRVYDLDPLAVAAVVESGVIGTECPAEAARGAEVVFTMLPVVAIAEHVCFGPGGIAEATARASVLVDMSTILSSETRRIGARLAGLEARMGDAPVGRTSAHAAAGTSAIMIGGEMTDIEQVRPLPMAMGQQVTVCGPLGAGTTMKLVNNCISAVVNLATAEGLAMGLEAGFALEVMTEVLAVTPAGRGQLSTAWPDKALADDPSPAFMLDLAAKVLGLAGNVAAEVRGPLVLAAVSQQSYRVAQAHGHGREDWTTGVFRTARALGQG